MKRSNEEIQEAFKIGSEALKNKHWNVDDLFKSKRSNEDIKRKIKIVKKLKEADEECKDKHWSVYEDGYYAGYRAALMWVLDEVVGYLTADEVVKYYLKQKGSE